MAPPSERRDLETSSSVKGGNASDVKGRPSALRQLQGVGFAIRKRRIYFLDLQGPTKVLPNTSPLAFWSRLVFEYQNGYFDWVESGIEAPKKACVTKKNRDS